MAYRKTLNVNLLSKSGVSEAYDVMSEALQYLTEFQPLLFLDLLGRRVIDELKMNGLRGEDITLSHEVDSKTTKRGKGESTVYKMSVSAKGYTVMFIEFGTGVPADSSQGLAKSNEFGAGSWSAWHMRTYQDWEASGKPMEEYPYNRVGADAFMKVEARLPDLIKQTANEVFGK